MNTTATPHQASAALARYKHYAEAAFDPNYGSANSEYRLGPISWNPDDGMVKGAVQKNLLGDSSINLFRASSVALTCSSDDGLVTYTLEVEQGHGVRLGQPGTASAARPAVSVRDEDGIRARYEVSLPAAYDAATALRISPFDPTSIPPGGRITLDSQMFSSKELEASFRYMALATKTTEASGVSYQVERLDEATVRVSMGPNSALSAFNGLGVTLVGITAVAGRQDAIGQSQVQTATFDLSQADGQAAYAHFVATGEVAAQTPGVSDVATIERLDASSQMRLKLGVGSVFAADLAGGRNAGDLTRTRFEDGSYIEVLNAQYDGQMPMTWLSAYDADGNEDLAARRYEFKIDLRDHPDGRQAGELLNHALNGSDDGGPLGLGKGDQPLTLSFDREQMQQLMQRMEDQARGNPFVAQDVRLLVEDGRGNYHGDVDRFALALARHHSAYSVSQRLFHTANDAEGGHQPIAVSVDSQYLAAARDASVERLQADDPRQRDNPDHGLLLQGIDAACRLDASLGRQPDMYSERLGMGLLVAARQEGLERIDSAVLGQEGSLVFAVQGKPGDADRQLARASTDDVLATSVQGHLERLRALAVTDKPALPACQPEPDSRAEEAERSASVPMR